MPDATVGQPEMAFGYTASGQRAQMLDASGVTSYAYDGSAADPERPPQGTLSYGYDDAGNSVARQSSNAEGASMDYTYDALNRGWPASTTGWPAERQPTPTTRKVTFKLSIPERCQSRVHVNPVNRLTDDR